MQLRVAIGGVLVSEYKRLVVRTLLVQGMALVARVDSSSVVLQSITHSHTGLVYRHGDGQGLDRRLQQAEDVDISFTIRAPASIAIVVRDAVAADPVRFGASFLHAVKAFASSSHATGTAAVFASANVTVSLPTLVGMPAPRSAGWTEEYIVAATTVGALIVVAGLFAFVHQYRRCSRTDSRHDGPASGTSLSATRTVDRTMFTLSKTRRHTAGNSTDLCMVAVSPSPVQVTMPRLVLPQPAVPESRVSFPPLRSPMRVVHRVQTRVVTQC